MAAGMMLWGPDGSLWMDTSSSLARLYGSVTITSNGSANVGLAGIGRPFAIQPQFSSSSWTDNNNNSYSVPTCGDITFTDNNNTVNVQFTWAGYQNPTATLYYGAY